MFPFTFLVVKNKVAIFGEGGGRGKKMEGKGKEKGWGEGSRGIRKKKYSGNKS